VSTDVLETFTEEEWRARAQAHQARVEPWVAPRRDRRSRGQSHPVDDFLFDYYPYSVGRITSWHPGYGIELQGNVEDFAANPAYCRTTRGVTANSAALDRQRARLEATIRILQTTATREANTGCFGMHEWAMVYAQGADEVRHRTHPLRLSREQVMDVVKGVGLRCTHFDAFRFFTSEAAPLNAVTPTRARQAEFEQPGCLHANMDLYKYAQWFHPFVSSELTADCFALARQARELDMRAAPYDLQDLGYVPIRVETLEGRHDYARQQAEITRQSRDLRERLLTSLRPLLSSISAS